MSKNHKQKTDAHDHYFDQVINGILKFQFYNYVDDSELSEKTWLSISTIHKIKHKMHFPTMNTLKKLKKAWVELPTFTPEYMSEPPDNQKPP